MCIEKKCWKNFAHIVLGAHTVQTVAKYLDAALSGCATGLGWEQFGRNHFCNFFLFLRFFPSSLVMKFGRKAFGTNSRMDEVEFV